MGFLDKIANKAKEAAENAKNAAATVAEKASVTFKEVSDNASDGLSSFSDNFSKSAKDWAAWAEIMPDKLKKMADDFDANAMWDKLAKTAAKAGQDLIVMVLTIYYAIESKIPVKNKTEK